jgi:predicted ester cyclase
MGKVRPLRYIGPVGAVRKSLDESSNGKLVRRFFNEILNAGNLPVVDQIIAPGFVGHMPGQMLRGPGNVRQMAAHTQQIFADSQYVLEDLIVCGDKVTARWTGRGVHQGTWRGRQPSGQRIRESGIGIFRIANGKIAELWMETNQMQVFDQLSGPR